MAPRIKRYADSNEVRNWALGLSDKEKKDLGIEGIEVSKRGRFHSDLVRAFNRIHRQEGIRYVPIGRNQPRRDDVFEAADKGDDDRPTVYRQPRQPREEAPTPAPSPEPAAQAVTPPTPLPVPSTPLPQVLAMPSAPEPVMELLRKGQSVVVVYVPLPMPAAV